MDSIRRRNEALGRHVAAQEKKKKKKEKEDKENANNDSGKEGEI